jgi:cytochrome c oxidase subunit II
LDWRVTRVARARRCAVAFAFVFGVAACGGSSSKSEASNLADRGAGLVQVKPCLVCHTTNGGHAASPSFAGLAGSRVALADGTTVTADDAYLKRSILEPGAQTVAGFPPGLMATLVKPGTITPLQADAIVAYIDTLTAAKPAK